MFYKEINNFLTKEDMFFIENTILGDNFPFYIYNSSVDNDKKSFLSHLVLKRLEDVSSASDQINSPHYTAFAAMILNAFDSINLKSKTIFRISVNLTFNNGEDKCDPHKDHDYPHRQLLICLNDVEDKKSKTAILDKDKKTVLKEFYPKKYKGVIFDDNYHYHYYPKKGKRVMLIVTFSI